MIATIKCTFKKLNPESQRKLFLGYLIIEIVDGDYISHFVEEEERKKKGSFSNQKLLTVMESLTQITNISFERE